MGQAQTPSPSDDMGDDYEPSGREKPVPYYRFREVNQQARQAKEALAQVQAQVEQLQQAHQAQLETIRSDAAQQVAGLQSSHGENLTFARLGLDERGVKNIRDEYETLPKAERPKTAAEWWQSVVEAHKAHGADPENTQPVTLHPTVSVLLPKVEAPAPDGGKARNGAPPPTPGHQRARDPGIPPRGSGRAAVLEAIKQSRGES